MNTTPLSVNISPEHKDIMTRIKQQYCFSYREQIEKGIERHDKTYPPFDSRFPETPATQPPHIDPRVFTSFSDWMHACEVELEESITILSCLNNAPTTRGRFITESDNSGGVYVRTTDNAKGILHLKSPKAISAFRLHLGNRINYQQMEMNLSPQESARVEHSLAELIDPPKKDEP